MPTTAPHCQFDILRCVRDMYIERIRVSKPLFSRLFTCKSTACASDMQLRLHAGPSAELPLETTLASVQADLLGGRSRSARLSEGSETIVIVCCFFQCGYDLVKELLGVGAPPAPRRHFFRSGFFIGSYRPGLLYRVKRGSGGSLSGNSCPMSGRPRAPALIFEGITNIESPVRQ